MSAFKCIKVNISSPFTRLSVFALVNMMCFSYFVHQHLKLMRRCYNIKILSTIENDQVYDRAWTQKFFVGGGANVFIPKIPPYTTKSGPPTARQRNAIQMLFKWKWSFTGRLMMG